MSLLYLLYISYIFLIYFLYISYIFLIYFLYISYIFLDINYKFSKRYILISRYNCVIIINKIY